MGTGEAEVRFDADFFRVSPLMIFPETMSTFHVYVKQDDRYVLYAREREAFTERHKRLLNENRVSDVYILLDQKPQYKLYLEKNLGRILQAEEVSLDERSKIFYDASIGVVRDLYEGQRTLVLDQPTAERIIKMVRAAVGFMAHKSALKKLAKLISHDYKTFTHSVQVFIYTVTVMRTFDWEEDDLIECGVGAILHDIGKNRVPARILNLNRPLLEEEQTIYQTHPVQGVAACAHLPLHQQTTNCILFHHEKTNGTGYPVGLQGDDLPLAVRILAVCNTYDKLASIRPGAAVMTPYEALTFMRDEMEDAFDPEAYKRLVMVLSGAAIV